MYEVELKVRADHDQVRTALDDRGAERTARVRQTDTYYDAPHREFAETDEALRIRRELDLDMAEAESDADVADVSSGSEGLAEWETTKVTYKGPLVEAASKTREEFETVVDDADSMQGILDGLGFAPAATVEKEREFFHLDGFTVTLDEVADLGTFCEVEAEGSEADIDHLREGAKDVLAALDLDADDQIRTSYLGMLLDARADGEAGEE
jgi:adenylate cyclase class 2